jgi:hypothetical protein
MQLCYSGRAGAATGQTKFSVGTGALFSQVYQQKAIPVERLLYSFLISWSNGS